MTTLRHALVAAAIFAGFAADASAQTVTLDAAAYRSQIEAHWLDPLAIAQVAAGSVAGSGAVTTQDDARGGCDGVRTGKWGFHTESQQDPWWQVDLGRATALDRAVIYNRCDSGAAGRLRDFSILASDDGRTWREVYRHDGSPVGGEADGKPLAVRLAGQTARVLRVQAHGTQYLHLDEVEVYAAADPAANIAPAGTPDQSSTSQWSAKHGPAFRVAAYPVAQVIERGRRLAADLAGQGVDVGPHVARLDAVAAEADALAPGADADASRALYLKARWAVRGLALANPLLDFDAIVFAKHAPGTFPHMSDQYYGWWSRPGGGVWVMEGFKTDAPRLRCLTAGLPDGSVLRPDLSFDGRRVLFAYARHYPEVSDIRNKAAKDTVPEDAFYHLYEVNVDGTGLRRLTHGRYDDFDARYLPDGRIVFLSTRRGQFVQCTADKARETLAAMLPDSYVRCGGDNFRPVAVYTLHVLDAAGGALDAISPFENFEWTPSVADDGRILYARWDYVDRNNMPYMSLWSTMPDGTSAQAVYGNYTTNPHCIFEARSIPDSSRLVFTASGHHSNTGGSLVLLDPDVAQDGRDPITRLTPEVCFPESEGWPDTYYASPWPLSQRYYLVAWSNRRLPPHTRCADEDRNPSNAQGLCLYDAFGNLEPLYRDAAISSQCPIPLRPRTRPPVAAPKRDDTGPQEGRFLVQDVYQGLPDVPRGSIRRLRIVAMPAKTQPHMNAPRMGVTKDDPAKCVLGTVPVEGDGSAYFRVPSGVGVFLQALDERGVAVQTMRSLTYVQAGQTLGCIGCHERRLDAPAVGRMAAAGREPSRITPGPEGSWPLRFDRLVQPVLDAQCGKCHRPGSDKPQAVAKLDLSPEKAYDALVTYAGKAGLAEHVLGRYNAGRSVAGQGAAATSPVLSMLTQGGGHNRVQLSANDLARLMTWMDTYAQVLGSFSADQEQRLTALREQWSPMLTTP
jgi:hypothetical protein